MGFFKTLLSSKRQKRPVREVTIYASFVKYILLEADNEDDALLWVSAAIDAGLIDLSSESDFELSYFDYVDNAHEDSLSYEDLIQSTDELISQAHETMDAVNKLKEEIENREDLSNKWVVELTIPLIKVVSVEADSPEDALKEAEELVESNSLEFTFQDIDESGNEGGKLEFDAVRLEYALENGITEEECTYLSTRVQVIEDDSWVYYIGRGSADFDDDKLGYWPFRFSDRESVEKICFDCVDILCAPEARHEKASSGRAGFFANYDDEETMRLILLFMISGHLIKRNPTGSLNNIEFRFVHPRRDTVVSLSDYVNLDTGTFLSESPVHLEENSMRGCPTFSVTHRIKAIKQPRGGYINPRVLKEIELNDLCPLFELQEENIHASLVGLAVDYLTRFICGASVEDAFRISFYGAKNVDKMGMARSLASMICGLDDASIVAACKLVGFDAAFRAGANAYRPVENIEPNKKTVWNIREMVGRGKKFFDEYGPVTHEGMTFDGGYTEVVSSGDGDFTTKDTLWDFKVSIKPPTKEHTLQICMYWLLGLHSNDRETYRAISRLGFFNPRLGMVYLIDVDTIPKEILHEIEAEVICYKPNETLF